MDAKHRSALSAGMTPGSTSCVDPERLAAWADRSLPSDEIAAIDVHVADCSRCQQIVAALAITDEAPERHAAAVVPLPLWRRLRLQWVAPLAAAAAVFWMVMPRGGGSHTAAPVDTIARADVPEQQPMTSPAPEATPQDRDQQRPNAVAPAPPRPSMDLPRPPRNEAVPQPQAKGRAGSARAAADRAGSGEREQVEAPSALAREIPTPAAPPPPAPVPATPAAAPAAPPSAPAESRTTDAVRPVVPVQTATSQLTKAVTGIEIRVRSAASSSAPSRPAAVGSAAAGTAAWRILGTVIEALTITGTWQRLPAISPAELAAGDAPSVNVCWLVGRAGTVMRTTDGRNFELLPSPASADLTAVRALDDRQARVTTADGRVFSTKDAGRTWVQTP